eukprot:9008498-Pyramimonas_sp.AAC.1
MRNLGFTSPKFANRLVVRHDELHEADVPPVILAKYRGQLQSSRSRRLVVPGQLWASAPPPPQEA